LRKAVVYARVSSKEQEKEGFSIPHQRKSLKAYAEKNGFTVDHEFIDIETAKQSGREHFGEMVGYLKENPSVQILLVEKTDRLYRNFRDYVMLDDLINQDLSIHLVKEGEVLSKDSKSHQKFIHGIKVLMAKNYIDNLSEEVKKGMAEKAAQGDYPHQAPFGYKNNTETHTIEVNEPVAKVVRRLFELYGSSQYSLRSLRNQATEEGLVRPSGKPLGVSHLEQILKNPIYYGEFRWKGDLLKGNHEPIISKSLFGQVQAVFHQANKPKLTAKQFAFRGLLTCGYCGCQLTAERKKNKYVYYRCTNAKGKCQQSYLREETVDGIMAEIVKGIQLSQEDLEFLRDGLQESLKNQKSYHEGQIRALTARYNQLQRRMEQIYEDKLDEKVSEAFWRQQTGKWQKEQEQVRQALAGHEKASASYFEEGVQILELAKQAYPVYVAASLEKKRKILSFLLSNCVLKDATPTPTYRKPFCWIAEGLLSSKWLPRVDSNHGHGGYDLPPLPEG
jgi:site-specific DNA recombinase